MKSVLCNFIEGNQKQIQNTGFLKEVKREIRNKQPKKFKITWFDSIVSATVTPKAEQLSACFFTLIQKEPKSLESPRGGKINLSWSFYMIFVRNLYDYYTSVPFFIFSFYNPVRLRGIVYVFHVTLFETQHYTI